MAGHLPSLNIVTAVDLHLLDVLVSILLCVAAAVADGIDDGRANLWWHVSTRATEVQVTLPLVNEVIDHLLLLLQAVRDINLLFLLTAQCQNNVRQGTFLLVLVEFSLVTVFLTIAGAKKQSHGSTLFAVFLGCRTLLNECSHWRDSSAQSNHHHWSLVRIRHGNGRWMDLTTKRDATPM